MDTKELIKKYPNETSILYNKGIEEGMKHEEPSGETIRMIKSMEDKFDTHLEYIKDGLKKNSQDHGLMFDKIDKWIENADEKFARKESVRTLDKKVEKMQTTREQRNYNWLYYSVTTIIGIVLAKFLL